MPKIFVLSGPDVGMSFEVTTGALLGRSDECSVPLRHPSVSREHAQLELDGGAWWLVDRGSRNGVVIGGERVPRVALADGDEFLLGEVLLRFRVEGVPAPGPVKIEPKPPVPAPPEPEHGDIVLEGDWDPNATMPAAKSAGAAPVPAAPAGADPTGSAPMETARERATAKLTAAGAMPKGNVGARGVLQYNRVENRPGFLGAELGQQPWWIQLAVWLLAAAVFVVIGWLAFRATVWMRGGTGGATVIEEGAVEER